MPVKAIVATPAFATFGIAALKGLFICVTSHEVTQASAANVAVVGSFASGFAVHFANVNEPLQWNFLLMGDDQKVVFEKF